MSSELNSGKNEFFVRSIRKDIMMMLVCTEKERLNTQTKCRVSKEILENVTFFKF